MLWSSKSQMICCSTIKSYKYSITIQKSQMKQGRCHLVPNASVKYKSFSLPFFCEGDVVPILGRQEALSLFLQTNLLAFVQSWGQSKRLFQAEFAVLLWNLLLDFISCRTIPMLFSLPLTRYHSKIHFKLRLSMNFLTNNVCTLKTTLLGTAWCWRSVQNLEAVIFSILRNWMDCFCAYLVHTISKLSFGDDVWKVSELPILRFTRPYIFAILNHFCQLYVLYLIFHHVTSKKTKVNSTFYNALMLSFK